MTYDLTLPVTLSTLGIAALAVVYVVSKDPARRSRAWQLLKLLLRRSLTPGRCRVPGLAGWQWRSL